jgi:hypothetical protein
VGDVISFQETITAKQMDQFAEISGDYAALHMDDIAAKREVEELVHNEIVSIARLLKVKKVLGLYIPTKKNELVSGLFERMGYKKENAIETGDYWELIISNKVEPKKHHIKLLQIPFIDPVDPGTVLL